MTETLRIERLGHCGDGIAAVDGADVFVPLTLPGEKVEAFRKGQRASLLQVLEESPARVPAPCPAFGVCGGCSLQHMHPRSYLAWKREQVRAALQTRGLSVEVDPVVPVPSATRRRTVFAARREGGAVRLGYHMRMSDEVVAVPQCPILMPQIERVLPRLADWLAPLVSGKGDLRVGVTATRDGLDVALEGPARRPPAIVAGLALGARRLGIVRLSIAGEPVLVEAPAVVEIDGADVELPPLAFLQASEASEEAIARLVMEGIGKPRRIADLYCGVGTFSLRLARTAPVLAVEGEAAALDALAQAARRAGGRKKIETLRRDLDRFPVSARELSRIDAVVFDPPRAGARAQAAEIARSRVPEVVAVSCNPGTLARDLRTLVDGGYEIRKVVPVDQFLYAPHIEVVAHLERS